MSSSFVVPADTVIRRARQAVSGSTVTLRYPEEVSSHSMIFNFKNYSSSQNGAVSNENKLNTVNAGSICLPLPKSLQDILSPQVEAKELGITGAGTRELYGAIQNGMDFTKLGADIANAATTAITTPGQDAITGFALFATRAGLTSMAPSVEMGLGVASGTAVNPHQALVFSGVAMKQYQFDWTLIPNNETESASIRNIITTFKRSSLPTYQGVLGGGGLATSSSTLTRGLLRYPKMVDVFFTGLDKDYFPLFKTAMITQVQADYTPQGNFVLNKGQAGSRPAIVHLTINITETEIHTAEDYGDSSSAAGSPFGGDKI